MGASQKEELSFSEGLTAAAGDNEIYLLDVDRYKDMVIQHVSAVNQDNACTHFILFKKRGDQEWVINDQLNPVAGTWYNHHDEIHLYHGSKLAVRFVGCTLADDIRVNAIGYIKDVD